MLAQGQTIWTQPGAGNWTTSSNWSPETVPEATTDVTIDNGGEAQVTFAGAMAAGLIVGGAAGSSGTLTITSGGTLATASSTPVIIGQNGTGTVTVTRSGSAWTNEGSLIVGDAAGSAGSVTVDMGATVSTGTAAGTTTIFANQAGSIGGLSVDGSGSIFATGNTLIAGNGGSASVRVSSGGTLTDIDAVLGASAGGSAVAVVTGLGSSWQTAGTLTLGGAGNASLTVEAAATTDATALTAGAEAGGSGTIKVSGNGSAVNVDDELTLGASGTGELTVESGGAVTADAVTLGAGATGAGSAKITGAGSSLTATSELTLGASGTGSLTVEAGGEATAASMTLGAETTGSGALTVTGEGSTVAADAVTIGGSGIGSATIEAGGALVSGEATLGANTGGSGAVTVNGTGSTWTTSGELTIGADGSGSLTVVGAGTATSATMTLGSGTGGSGALAVSGSGSDSTTSGILTVGAAGAGSANISLGASLSAGSVVIGSEAGGSGSVLITDNGSALDAGASLTVGDAGSGTLTLANGGTAVAETASIGASATGTGDVTITNLGSTLAIDGAITVGAAGSGTLAILSSGTMTSGDATLGAEAGGSGLATVTGAGSDWSAGAMTIGGLGDGTLQVTAAGTLESGAAVIGASAGGQGTVTVDGDGSVWTTTGDLVIGASGTGNLLINAGGTVSVQDGGGAVTLAANAGSTGVLQIGTGAGAGTLDAASITGGDGTALVVFDHGEAGYTFAPLIAGSAAVSLIGSGTTIFTAANTYDGTTTVDAGTLQAGGTDVLSPSSALSVASGATLDLAGYSQVVSNLANSGTVTTAGSVAGTTLTVSGDYVGTNGALVLGAVLGGDGASTDRLAVAGDVSGTTRLAIINLGGTGAQTTGDGIELVSVGGASASDAFSTGRIIVGAYDYRLYQGGAAENDGNWYLRSDLSLAAQTYAAMPATLVNYALSSIGNYRQRTGAWSYGPIGSSGDAWMRGAGNWRSASPDGASPYDQGLQFGQAGFSAELPAALQAPGELSAGLMATFGRSSTTVTEATHGVAGSGSIDTNAWGIGGNLTWTGSGPGYDGLYADAVGQLTWYDADIGISDGGGSSGNGAFGGAISLEVGKWIEISKGWAIVPQGQLVYAVASGDAFTDGDGTRVDNLTGNSLVGRAGLRLEHGGVLGGGVTDTMRLNAYLLANLAYAFTGNFSVDVGGTPMDADQAALMGELGLGATLQMTAGAALYGEASYAAAASGGSDQRWSGNFGVRMDW
ncbi:autotransporter outer membrane beta-barrel domain-containing protein [Mesorhizobium sp. BR1-1-16]|uniref:autotransporter outer membrane beta-barrel domain-containing protein n=1 Tax=Mesorhizobium sp. BR1-1-16 TaxID=2876653 RepID=UPI001CCCC44B|nr:autotransporter outer membrane beta-barrel domain-containing protein [Mesorhizobium sp. BR1-1-16]MBZ9937292.1 autotransporter outer membrane beta-barrel domain-containing protein [Mesorhizobium sp. BR1-1-16]